jgi:hypothetical protein
MPKSKPTPPRETKAAILRRLLARKAGADLAALQLATGWQPHSVRAGLSGLRKAGYIIDRTDATKPSGTATYRITGGPAGAR